METMITIKNCNDKLVVIRDWIINNRDIQLIDCDRKCKWLKHAKLFMYLNLINSKRIYTNAGIYIIEHLFYVYY